jgi:succinate-acetate transporter protein
MSTTNGQQRNGLMDGQGARKPQGMISQVMDPTFRKPANPGPLGLISFALTTFVLGLYQCGAGLPNSNPHGGVGPDQVVFGLAVFFGGTAQFVAGIMEFVCGNTFGTTVHCAYGAFWLAYAMFLIPSLGIQGAYMGDERAFSFALGIFLILWCFLTLLFLVGALRTNMAIIGVLGFLTLAFFFLALAEFTVTTHPTASVRLNKAGGAFSVICALLAFYAGASGIMQPETTWVRFPLGVISRAQPAASSKSAA